MIQLYKKTWLLLDEKERNKTIIIIILTVIMSCIEVIGVGSIMPFLAVVGNPGLVESNEYLFLLFKKLEFKSLTSFLIFLGITSFIIIFFSVSFKSYMYYLQQNFINMRRHSLSLKLLKKYLHQPYSFFISKNSSDLSKTILSEVDVVVSQALSPALKLISDTVLTLLLVSFLIAVDPVLALILTSIFSLFYGVIYFTVRRSISKMSTLRAKANTARFKITSEIIGGIKDLKVLGGEEVYLNNFIKPSSDFSMYTAKNQTLSNIPQYMIEAILFGALLSVIIFVLFRNGEISSEILSLIGIYALGALKLKPAMNGIFSAFTAMKFGEAALNTILKDLQKNDESISISSNKNKLSVRNNILLKNLSFTYNNAKKASLEKINLNIKAYTTIGIIGKTGAGKSTLVDIILGLLSPTDGEILIDGAVLSKENLREWQNSIGYVPQSIFLADDSIVSNIAFGVKKENIDLKQIEIVAKMAQVDEFVLNLENGYDTIIGERGVKLSGGQRQRIGIARALYTNPELLILDEATSALDNHTEEEVMKAIDSMSGSKTIIIIAHRLSTIEKCDTVVNLENAKMING